MPEVANDETREYSTASMSELKKMVGISVLLGLSQQVRDGGMNLPRPGARRDSQGSLHGNQPYLQ